MFKSNKVNMVISLVMAVVLWLYVAGQVDPKTDKKIPDVKIHYLNIDSLQDNGYDFAESSDSRVEVTVEGKRAQLNRIDEEDIKVTADLHDCAPGKNTITLKAVTSKKAEISKINPATITVTVEERVNRSKPVRVVFTGKDSNNSEPGNVTTNPENINVYGAKSVVDKVKYVKASVPKSKIDHDYTTITAKAVPVDKKGNRVRGVWLSAKRVEVTASMMKTKKVDLSVETTGEITGDHQLDRIKIPKTVEIKGSSDELESIDSVQGNTIDISGVKETQEIPITFDLPYGVEIGDESEGISIKVILKDLARLSFEIKTGDIKMTGLSDNMEAVMTESSFSVTVKGTDEEMEGFKKEDADFSVDLSKYDVGRHAVKIEASSDKELHSIVVSPEKANVEIKSKTAEE